jgi:hypothetical protein
MLKASKVLIEAMPVERARGVRVSMQLYPAQGQLLSHKLCFQLVIEVAFHNYVKTFA